MRRRFLPAVVVAALAGLASGCGSSTQESAPGATSQRVADFRRVDPDAARLLDGGLKTFRGRLSAAKGRPLVVNQWASWCGPCRAEFPAFQRQALKRRGKVAFLGVDARDSKNDATSFLARYPTPFAHVADPDGKIAREIGGGRAWPTTVYYDAAGRRGFIHQGSYRDEAALARDIDRYALR